MAYVYVDVGLDEIDLEEILDEVERRYSHWSGNEKKEIKDFFEELLDVPNPIFSLDNKMKIDFLNSNIETISLTDLENLIK